MDNLVEEYIYEHLDAESKVLNDLYRHTNRNVPYSGMISGHEQGRLLSMISRMIRPEKILEIGTYTGYSAICLAEGLSVGGRLHTVEIDDELADTALSFFEKAGMNDKITLHTGDAVEIIPNLDMLFDLVFIDAAKKQYLNYYHAVFDKVKSGGYIIIDNILWFGKVADLQFQDEATTELRRFNDFVRDDTRVEKAIITNRDGLYILRKVRV